MSPLRERKLKKLFTLTDVDGNGVIEFQDYLRVLDFLSRRRGWKEDSPSYQHLKSLLVANWEGLQARADSDNDGRVTEQEWLETWRLFYQHVEAEDGIPEWFREFAGSLFEALDIDGDGQVSPHDYATFLEAHGLQEPVDELFARLDLNGDGRISAEEALVLAAEFHLGDDPEAPGCWLYGELPA